ncbi:hypothetical protein L873DRAFT_69627 [Choiromyces venosus 120613-1]|uniref:Uncharacterized protein n=1 Tax=Choiromyces venosus 120613-1 TaxID=1336337 RepID=A0A3N4J8F1_9PEZI|nr:hypothetical protein L873DRAFT_69627 [Choiromyces venosus 120613-1]
MNPKSRRVQRKENRKEHPQDPEREIVELRERLQVQEQQVGVLREKTKQWEKKYNDKRDAESEKRKKTESLEETVKKHAEKEALLSQQLETIMKDTLVPIIAAVVMKAMYKRAARVPQQDQNAGGQDDRVERIRNLRSRFLELGYENAEQVVEFADMWSEVIAVQNTAPRSYG